MSRMGSRDRRGSRVDSILNELGMPVTEVPLESVMELGPERTTYPRGKDGKVMFPSNSTATAAARRLLNLKKGNVSSLRTYLCPECAAWHMSSSFHK